MDGVVKLMLIPTDAHSEKWTAKKKKRNNSHCQSRV